MDQSAITREESALSADLRAATAELLAQTRSLLGATRDAVESLAPRLAAAVEASAPDSMDDEDGPGQLERVERAVTLLHKISVICKNNADTGEKAIKLERQVRGDPTDVVAIQRSAAIPDGAEEMLLAIEAEAAAVRRHLDRTRKRDESSDASDDDDDELD